jgi:hypothetical protein
MRAAGDIDHPDVIAEFLWCHFSHYLELEAEFPARGFFNMVTGHKTGQLHLGRRTFLAAWLQIMQAW